MSKQNVQFMQGNIAMTEGAIAAGARFYAGYPITPSSEVAEHSSVRLPQEGGLYVQMEDEIGSIAAVIGASAAGKMSYTATSGPGFSLMQENLGVAVMSEIPCVIINVQRSGPSTGLATKPAQGDFMMSRWGTHGDHGIIVLCPASVQECYDLMIEAFRFSEEYRTPVVFLSDEIIGHMQEKVVLHNDFPEIVRKKPTCPPGEYKPFDPPRIAPLARYGGEYVFRLNGSGHDEMGYPCATPANTDTFVRHFTEKIEKNYKDIVITKGFELEDAEVTIIAYGASLRSSLEAMKQLRKEGHKVGVLQLKTLWPFAKDQVSKALETSSLIVVPELNLGQMIQEVEKLNKNNTKVIGINKVNSLSITPKEIVDRIKESRF